MIIALDYDGTYTADPTFWEKFISMVLTAGHQVYCVTMRYPSENIVMTIPVYYTKRQAKMSYCKDHNIEIDIWIDDKPGYIFDNALSYEQSEMTNG